MMNATLRQVLFFAFVSFLTLQQLSAQDLPRRATWETTFKTASPIGKVIQSLNDGSPMQKAGFQKGDIILQVNDQIINSAESWSSIDYAIRADQKTKFMLRRGSEVLYKTVVLNPLGLEKHEGLDTHYESVTSDYGIKQRVIITKPKDVETKQPVIFLVQGLSCSTIEKYSGRGGNWVNQINSIVENSGMVVVRVDKPGVGDSEGDCAETDFITELEGYRAALRLLKQKDYIDTTKIVIYGASMGSALAPLLANEFNAAGVISDGVFFKTWFEHMLEIERRIRQMSGDDEETITKKMNEAYIPLYYGMLIQKKTYQEVIDEFPAIAKYNYHSPAHMYGRPVEYYQQLQDFNLASQWEKVKVPVRILYGTNDWIMSEFDNKMIINVLDRVGHKDHKLHIYQGLDHWNTIHKSPEDSFNFKKGEWDPKVPELIISWAKKMVGL
jgi:pimeloyl-ACP methyl ester carboxylesterase